MGFGTGNLGMGITFSMNNQASGPAKAVGNSIRTLSQTVQQAGTNIVNNANKITTGLIGVGIVVGALIGPFVGVTKAAANFDSVMSELSAKANLDKASESMEELTAQSIALGDATKFSAKEVGQGQTFLAMAGFNANNILTSMPGLLDLATAGNLGLARASDIASNTMAQFNLKAADMAHISDVIANAATNSNQSVEQFAQGMKFLGPTASALGISLEEASSTMMLLANAGLQSSLGTRALGTSLASRLTGAIPKANEEMKKLGLNVFSTTGDFVGMEEMIKRTTAVTKNLTQQQRMQSLSIIFGAESIQEITTLMKAEIEVMKEGEKVILKGADAMAHFTNENIKAAGSAKLMAERMLDDLAGDMVKFQGVLETTAIVAGAGLAEAMRPVVQMATRFLKVVKVLLANPVGKWFMKAAAGVAVFVSGLIILGFVATTVAPAIWGMVTAAWSLLVPLLPIIAAVGAVAGAVVFLTKSYSRFTDVLRGGDIDSGILGFMQKLGAAMQAGVMIWKTWNGETFTLTENMHAALKKLGILDEVLTMGTYIVRVKEFFTGFQDGVEDMGATSEVIWEDMNLNLEKLMSNFTNLNIEIGKNESKLSTWQEAGKWLGIFWEALKAAPIAILRDITFYVNELIDLLRELADLPFMEKIADFLMPLVNLPVNLVNLLNPTVGFADKSIFDLKPEPSPNRMQLVTEPTSNPVTSGEFAAQNRAASFPPFTGPTVIDKTVTTQGNVTIINEMDGEEIGRNVFTKQQLDDNRN